MRKSVIAIVLVGCSSGGAFDGGPESFPDAGAPVMTGKQTDTCKRYLACAAQATPTALPALTLTYGADGTCWHSNAEEAAACETACEAGLDQESRVSSVAACAPFHFCGGTDVAKTCAGSFFGPFATCFQPAGSCISSGGDGTSDVCWPSTGALQHEVLNNSYDTTTYSENGTICMTQSFPLSGNLGKLTFVAGGQTLVYDQATGDVVCPDGSSAYIGPNGSDCHQLQQLLYPAIDTCNDGTCP